MMVGTGVQNTVTHPFKPEGHTTSCPALHPSLFRAKGRIGGGGCQLVRGFRGDMDRQRLFPIRHALAFKYNTEEVAPCEAQVIEGTEKRTMFALAHTHHAPPSKKIKNKFERKSHLELLFSCICNCGSTYPLLHSRLRLLSEQRLQGSCLLAGTAPAAHSWSQKRESHVTRETVPRLHEKKHDVNVRTSQSNHFSHTIEETSCFGPRTSLY